MFLTSLFMVVLTQQAVYQQQDSKDSTSNKPWPCEVVYAPNNYEEHNKFFPVNQSFHAYKVNEKIIDKEWNRQVFMLFILIYRFPWFDILAAW